jgi:hypothetical protein
MSNFHNPTTSSRTAAARTRIITDESGESLDGWSLPPANDHPFDTNPTTVIIEQCALLGDFVARKIAPERIGVASHFELTSGKWVVWNEVREGVFPLTNCEVRERNIEMIAQDGWPL